MTNDPVISHAEIMELLETVKADKDARRVFLMMTREDQLLAILGMIAFTNSQVANMQKDLLTYRNDREKKEQNRGDFLMDTAAKIAEGVRKELAGRFDFWIWFRDKILPTVVTIIVLAMLYFVFGGKIPSP